MRRKFLIAFLVMPLFLSKPAFSDVAITAENFPDEIFRSYIANELGADKNHDGSLSASEIAEVDIIRVDGKKIDDLSGIEYFTALEQLYCYNNNLESVDVSQNVALLWLECDGNQLSRLDVSRNTNLITLECENNNIAELDLSSNKNLTYAKCYAQKLYGLEIVNENDGYQFDIGKYVSNFDKIIGVVAYNASGDVISGVEFDNINAMITMPETPAHIKYCYQVDYVKDPSLSMDVTIMGTAYDEVAQSDDSSSSRCGGCNAGWNIFALSFVLLYLPLLKKR